MLNNKDLQYLFDSESKKQFLVVEYDYTEDRQIETVVAEFDSVEEAVKRAKNLCAIGPFTYGVVKNPFFKLQ